MNGEAFVTFAGKLAAGRADPAAYRSAASRSYYGVFHMARSLLQDWGFHCDDGNEHLGVQRHFSNCSTSAAYEVGRTLANLHDARKRSDYDLSDTAAESQRHAQSTALIALHLLEQIAWCAADANRDRVREEVVAYRKKIGKN